VTKKGVLTSWRSQGDRQVRVWKETDQARYSQTRDSRGRNRQVRTQKESNRARGTHILEAAEGREKPGQRKKKVRNHKIRDKEGKADPILEERSFSSN
jgi:hypothetical protein